MTTHTTKVICTALSALILGSILMTGCGDTAKQSSTETQAVQAAANTVQTQGTGTDIGVEAAVKKSLEHAGLDESSVTIIKQHTDYDDGVKHYDIEFVTDDAKYEYEIHAVSGDVLDFSKESITSANTVNNAEGYIGLDAAKTAALSHAQLAESDVVFTKSILDDDDGVAEYEIEFVANSKEYEYSIHAESGDIIEYDVDMK